MAIKFDVSGLDDLMRQMTWIKMQDWLSERASKRSMENMAKMLGGYENLAKLSAALEQTRAGNEDQRLRARAFMEAIRNAAEYPDLQRSQKMLNIGMSDPAAFGRAGYNLETTHKEYQDLLNRIAKEAFATVTGNLEGRTEEGLGDLYAGLGTTPATQLALEGSQTGRERAAQRSRELVAGIENPPGKFSDLQRATIDQIDNVSNIWQLITRIKDELPESITNDPDFKGLSAKRSPDTVSDEVIQHLEEIKTAVMLGKDTPEMRRYLEQASNVSAVVKSYVENKYGTTGLGGGGGGVVNVGNINEYYDLLMDQQVQKFISSQGGEPSFADILEMRQLVMAIINQIQSQAGMGGQGSERPIIQPPPNKLPRKWKSGK